MRKIAIGITGASGSIYAKVLLEKLKAIQDIELALVMSDNAKDVWKFELQNEDYLNLNIKMYSAKDYFAPFASGSSSFEALVIVPCSMGTLGRIANGMSDNLITRAADVMLKERRKLICMVRDTPYNLIHIENMKKVTEAGGIICPASPSFYSLPKSFDELAATVVDRVIGLLGLSINTYRWSE
ncbi:MAG TPA: UbiX family flavin prenyltransferase [Chitinophagaceae bacterium]|nr:UbiX family flavin prenyltransferase [Chitinophagaceae bacterium]